MATVTKVNPTLDLTVIDYLGTKPLTIMAVDFVADASAETGPNEAVQAVIQEIQKYCSIIIRGELIATDTQMVFFLDLENDTQNWDGNGAETLVEQIEDDIQALGEDYGDNDFDMSAVTCQVKTSLGNLAHS